MKTITIREIKTKSGKVIPTNTEVIVEMAEHSTRTAIISYEDFKLKIPALSLSLFCKGFMKVDNQKLIREMKRSDNTSWCKSLTGERVEPDGIDINGFPSILLAAGYV